MLVILNDPAGVTGVRRFPLDRSVSLQANIERHLSGGADAELLINGERVDPLQDPRLDMPPGVGDSIVIALRPAGLSVPVLIALSIAAAIVVTVALRPNIPDIGSAGKDSPNNRLTAQTNVARAYQAIPDVFGYRRVWPDLIQRSTVEYVDQVKYVTEWLCISRGRGTLSDVRYADTPISDIAGSSYEVFQPTVIGGYPELGTTTLADVYEPFESQEVNGQEIPAAIAFAQLTKTGTFAATAAANTFTVAIPDGTDLSELKGLVPSGTAQVSFSYTPAGGPPAVNFNQSCTVLAVSVAAGTATFTFSSATWATTEGASGRVFTITPSGANYSTVGPFTLSVECSQLWWNTVFLRGLKGSVTLRAEWWKVDAAGAEIGGTRQTQDNTYTADTYDQRFYTNKVTPAAGTGRYRMQFQRRTVAIGDTGVDVAKLEEVFAIRYFPTKQVPGATVIRVTTKATTAATGFSERKFNARWLRHVRALNSGTLSGSRNFGRALAHLWGVAGNDFAGLDLEALQAINVEHGEDSPPLRFDGSLDDADMALGARMALIADTARCKVWRDGTKWTFVREQRRDRWAMQFDYRNLARGGDSSLTYSAHLPASFDGVSVEYVDEATQSKKAYAPRNISTGVVVVGVSRNPKKIQLLGCASAAQAENRADLEARRLLYQRETVSDTALAEASDLPLGELVRWVDPNDFGGDDMQAGEVLAIDADVITLSEAVSWGSATSGRIMFTVEDGSRAGPPATCYPVGDKRVRVVGMPTGVYVAGPDRQCGSRYSFAVGLTADEIEAAALYLVTEVKPSANRTVSIALTAYDARMYEAD